MDTSILEDLGLTGTQIKVYLALLELGECTAGPILKETGLQNSVLHLTLGKLVGKGFVSYISRGKRRYYRPADPKTILKFIDERKKRFEEILPDLLSRHKSVEKEVAEVYEGYKGLRLMLYELISDSKKGDEYLYFSFYTDNPDDFDNVYNFYRYFEKEREKKGIITKGIVPLSRREKFKGRNLRNIKFVDFPVPTNISIFRDKVVLTPWADRQVSFMIYSKQLADSFRKYFYSVYNSK
jgi:predicted transcriptional regulator